jgi:hypothetical protein
MRRPLPRLWSVSASMLVAFVVIAPSAQGSSEGIQPMTAYRYRAVAFDYLVLFNPDSIVADAERAFPPTMRV